MEYVVIKGFTDKYDKTKYRVGDRYPRTGFAKKERAEELSTSNNARGEALIVPKKVEKVEEPVKKETKKKSAKKND